MKRLIEFFIKYPVGVDALLIGFFFFGWISYGKLNTTFFPLVESRDITISAVYPVSYTHLTLPTKRIV